MLYSRFEAKTSVMCCFSLPLTKSQKKEEEKSKRKPKKRNAK